MSKVTTVEAADMAGVSRSTIWRACKSGRLSAERTGKDFLVDVSELERAFPLKFTRDKSGVVTHVLAFNRDLWTKVQQ